MQITMTIQCDVSDFGILTAMLNIASENNRHVQAPAMTETHHTPAITPMPLPDVYRSADAPRPMTVSMPSAAQPAPAAPVAMPTVTHSEPVDVPQPFPVDAPQPDVPNDGAVYDSVGTMWDERLHSAAKTQNSDGTWRKRKSSSPFPMPSAAQPAPAATEPVDVPLPFPPMPSQPAASAPLVMPQPMPVTVRPAPAASGKTLTFFEVMPIVSGLITSGRLTVNDLATILADMTARGGKTINSLTDCMSNPAATQILVTILRERGLIEA